MQLSPSPKQRICAVLEEDQIALLSRVAREQDRSLSYVLRQAVNAWAKRVPFVAPGRPEPEFIPADDGVEA